MLFPARFGSCLDGNSVVIGGIDTIDLGVVVVLDQNIDFLAQQVRVVLFDLSVGSLGGLHRVSALAVFLNISEDTIFNGISLVLILQQSQVLVLPSRQLPVRSIP